MVCAPSSSFSDWWRRRSSGVGSGLHREGAGGDGGGDEGGRTRWRGGRGSLRSRWHRGSRGAAGAASWITDAEGRESL